MVESPALAGQAPQSSQRPGRQAYPEVAESSRRIMPTRGQVVRRRQVFWVRMAFADKSRDFYRGATGKGVGIDDLSEAFMGGATVYADKQLVVSRTVDPAGLRFSGEIDVTNRDAVGNCLAMTPGGEGDIHLDISQLIFCDISGIRAFVDAAEARAKGRLLLHGLPELLQTVLRVTGWADLPGLVVCKCEAGPA